MTGGRKPHVLVVTNDCCKTEDHACKNLKFRIECPGLAEWCEGNLLCSNPEDAAMDTGDEFGEAHGLRHRRFEPYGWTVPSGTCHVAEWATGAADNLIDEKDLGAGRYPIDCEGDDEGGLRLYLWDEAPWNKQEAAAR